MLVIFLGVLCRKPQAFDDESFDPRLSGGAATAFNITSQAFGECIEGLSPWDQLIHDKGDGLFEQTFVSAPAPLYPGLGPIFNNVSCVSCHHNDGIGIPTAGKPNSSLLVRISLPGEDEHGGPLPVPGFGTQLQDQAVFGAQPEARVNITYTEEPFRFPDGETVSLRKPHYQLSNAYRPLPGHYLLSPRLAPYVFGIGLLELIPSSTVLSFADPEDKNGDGIRGHPNYVYDPVSGQTVLGRFGLKANTPTVAAQVASAFQQDMGLSNKLFSSESALGQSQDDKRPDDPELPDSILNAMVFYIQTLAVPARRNVTDPVVKKGEALFEQLQCSSCHIPTLYTGVNVNLPTLSHQRIHPYTDLLLHDMGPGLADGRPDYQATGSEWRTSPLWGIGMVARVNGTPYYLHDGRARTLTEAILWHGGEAEQSRENFVQLRKSDRDALLSFLNSL
ncbi:di-heme oxidoredictase family protein [Compostibacter hankyongensis]|uniref:Di-heme oxidoredictase family protein n=1 Tax=Compostibacter hankyongensis TaxID=1007089 RepID=A0ABP8FU50_9BACT